MTSLAGTRTSHRWGEKPGGWDTVNARAIYPSSNEYGIPDLPITHGQPARLVAYNDKHAIERSAPGDCVHFFLDDYRFESMWRQPNRSIPRVQRVGCSLTPDFSLYAGMPMAMQLWQAYRSRWCGAWMTEHGIDVIPTVSWSTPASYDFAFAGIARGSVVALSAVGVHGDQAHDLYAAGMAEMIARIEPPAILCYGPMPFSISTSRMTHPVVIEYPTRWEQRHGRPGQ